jgi:hypothetical protein
MGDVISFPGGNQVRGDSLPAGLRHVGALHHQLHELPVHPGQSADDCTIELTGLHMQMARVRHMLPDLVIAVSSAAHDAGYTHATWPLADAAKQLDDLEATAWTLCAEDVPTTARIHAVHRLRIQAGELAAELSRVEALVRIPADQSHPDNDNWGCCSRCLRTRVSRSRS